MDENGGEERRFVKNNKESESSVDLTSEEVMKCDFRSNTLSNAKLLSKHSVNKRKIQQTGSNNCEKKYTCKFCEKSFSSVNSLSRHRVKVHKIKQTGEHFICHESDCRFTCNRREKLLQHLHDTHKNVEAFTQQMMLNFNSVKECDEWRENEEKMKNCRFVAKQRRRITESSNIRHGYLTCNRSGQYKAKCEVRKRKLKTRGTVKIGCQCTAAIKTEEDLSTGKVVVRYCFFHYGHDNTDIQHVSKVKRNKKNGWKKCKEDFNAMLVQVSELTAKCEDEEKMKEVLRRMTQILALLNSSVYQDQNDSCVIDKRVIVLQ